MNIIASLFNLAGPDLIVILLIVLLLFGSKKLPELARGMGQAVKEFNKAKEEIERELTKTEVTVQPAPGQQPRQPAELPVAPPPVVAAAPAPVVAQPVAPQADPQLFGAGAPFQQPPVAQSSQPIPPVENPHPAGQA
ncbi:MAG: twin-arginine translocase TatA/TatE family subunit [Chthoniobacteraceae bacterium]|jgi:sec-independent protein translocase protein TatA